MLNLKQNYTFFCIFTHCFDLKLGSWSLGDNKFGIDNWLRANDSCVLTSCF